MEPRAVSLCSIGRASDTSAIVAVVETHEINAGAPLNLHTQGVLRPIRLQIRPPRSSHTLHESMTRILARLRSAITAARIVSSSC